MRFKTYFWGTLPIFLVLLVACSSAPGKYDAFAQCLTEHNVKMYGAYWCSHCENQKAMFGSSWKKVEYVECSLPGNRIQTEFCAKAGITSYPTWEFANGTRILGELSLLELNGKSGCRFEA